MEKDLRSIFLFEETFAYANRIEADECVDIFKKELNSYLDKISSIVDTDIDSLSDLDFYELIGDIYKYNFSLSDFFKLFSQKYGKKFVRLDEIRTNMFTTVIETSGHGRSFDWWEQQKEVNYLIAVDKSTLIDHNKLYSKVEIENLLFNKSILLLHAKFCDFKYWEKNGRYVDFEPIPLSEDFDADKPANIMGSNFIYANFELVVSFLRKRFPKRVILKDLKMYLIDLLNQLDEVFSYSEYGINVRCLNWYNSSSAKNRVATLQKKLK